MTTMTQPAPLRTANDLRALPDEGAGYELLSGTLIAIEPPSEAHERLVDRLRSILSAHVEDGDLGALFRAPWPVEISRYDLVRPDLAFVSWGRDGVIAVDGVRGAPELVVEMLSPASRDRDRGEKQRMYNWAKVFEYWIVDPDARTFEAFTKTPTGYKPIEHDGRQLTSVLLPDLTLDLAELFG
jgi:Uma2 family endonuclease